jgi:Holliday junction resolvase RusA-like endonuclease
VTWTLAAKIDVRAVVDRIASTRKITSGPRAGQTVAIWLERSTGPVGQPRARAFVRKAQNVAHIKAALYTPHTADKWKRAIKDAWDAAGFKGPFMGPLQVVLRLEFMRPREQYAAHGKSDNLRADAPEWHTTQPDVDNAAKSVFDALEDEKARTRKRVRETEEEFARYKKAAMMTLKKRAWANDCQISRLVAEKKYARAGRKPGAVIRIYVWRQ